MASPAQTAPLQNSSFTHSLLFPAWCVAAVIFILHIVTAPYYGYFRDELYFIACSDHLAAGYVDFAPLAAWILKANRVIFGDSLYALRWLPGLAHAALVVLTGMLARELGGKRFAVLLSAIAVGFTPVILCDSTRYSMNPFEPLFWMSALYLLIRVINGGDERLLLGLGVACGLGVENKHSTIFFMAALLLALALTPQRRFFASKWFWGAVGITIALALPNLIWQIQHDYPTYVDLHNVKVMHKNVELPPLPWIKQQIVMLNQALALLWIPAIGFLLWHRDGKKYRVVGLTFLFFFLELMLMKGKDYYVAPIYPVMFAAGCVLWETLSEVRFRWIRRTLAVVTVVASLVAVPIVVPILPPEKANAYIRALAGDGQKTEVGMHSQLPQYFADEFGWPELVEKTAQLYHSLPPEEQAKTAILGGSYGDAGAIDFFGAKYGLPKSISAHQNYWYWGPRDYTGESVIILHWRRSSVEKHCSSVVEGPTLDHPWAMEEEHYTIWLCKGMKPGLQEFWPDLKNWN
ncbi:glycosyl transferase, family 39 [Candidatus Koribacter versatilis Ellin345]|uniref:Glycosyl transferase, family 39 n=1 Tax=Koribacter versatilis (strain Ellin345) TaxID=204669 RepID=Q1II20_KORVE|nr:glycosyltransferase family 39 protein [Candidatus Koribacter versatilis]ABF43480.1 glycosyl transferase, family 39 [Candidatus Koribacter versatilis Ellin345]